MECTVALSVPAFLAITARVGSEQNAVWPKACLQLSKDLRQHLAGHMEKHGIGKHSVKALRGQIKIQEALLQHLTAAVGPCHSRRAGRAFETDGTVAQRFKGV